MRRLLLLGLAVLTVSCDSDVSDPPPEPVELTVGIAGPSGEPIGAVLVSVPGAARDVVVRGGWERTTADGGRTVIAGVLPIPRPRVRIHLAAAATGAGSPQVELLQVVGPDNVPYPTPAAFTVEVREEGAP